MTTGQAVALSLLGWIVMLWTPISIWLLSAYVLAEIGLGPAVTALLLFLHAFVLAAGALAIGTIIGERS